MDVVWYAYRIVKWRAGFRSLQLRLLDGSRWFFTSNGGPTWDAGTAGCGPTLYTTAPAHSVHFSMFERFYLKTLNER